MNNEFNNSEQNVNTQINQMENPVPGSVPTPGPSPAPMPGPAPSPAPMPAPGPMPGPAPMPTPAPKKNNNVFLIIIIVLIIIIGALIYFVISKNNKTDNIDQTTTEMTTTTVNPENIDRPDDVSKNQSNTKRLGDYTFTIPSSLEYQLLENEEVYLEKTAKYMILMDFVPNQLLTQNDIDYFVNDLKKEGMQTSVNDIIAGTNNYKVISGITNNCIVSYIFVTFNTNNTLIYGLYNYGISTVNEIINSTINNITISGKKSDSSSFAEPIDTKEFKDIKLNSKLSFPE